MSQVQNSCFIVLYFLAVKVKVVARETIGDWVRFNVQLVNHFKYPSNKVRRREEHVWAPVDDVTCGCPKIGLQKVYLLVGMVGMDHVRPNSLVVDRNSVVLLWEDDLLRRLKQFQRDQDRGKC